MNATKPLVSISCLTYNHVKYIHKTLEGFLMQKTSFPIEILIHDDASNDGTTEIVKDYEKKYPEIIKPKYESENQWNKGIRGSEIFNFPRANGKYIALCEGDDYWTDPLKLQKQVDFLEVNQDYIISYHDAMIVDENGTIIKSSKLPNDLKRDFSTEEIIKGAWILTLAMCFRNVLKEYPEEYFKVLNGDTFLSSLLGNFGKGKYMSDIAPAVYRLHSASIWSKLDNTEKLFHSGVTYAWMCRYYKRIGQDHYAYHFKNMSIHQFIGALSKVIATGGQQHVYIVNNILTEYNDIINVNNTGNLFDVLRRSGYLTDTKENGDDFKGTLPYDLSHQQPKKLLELGEKKFSQGDVHTAVKLFEKVLLLDRTNSQAMNNLGVIQWQLGGVVSAMKIFQTALSFNSNDPDALANLLQAATKTGRFDLIDSALMNRVKEAQPANPDLVKLINAQQDSAKAK